MLSTIPTPVLLRALARAYYRVYVVPNVRSLTSILWRDVPYERTLSDPPHVTLARCAEEGPEFDEDYGGDTFSDWAIWSVLLVLTGWVSFVAFST